MIRITPPRPSCENVCRGNRAVPPAVPVGVWLRLHCAADAARRRLAAGSTGFRPGVDPGGAARMARGARGRLPAEQPSWAVSVSSSAARGVSVCLQVGSGAADRFSRWFLRIRRYVVALLAQHLINIREAPNSQLFETVMSESKI